MELTGISYVTAAITCEREGFRRHRSGVYRPRTGHRHLQRGEVHARRRDVYILHQGSRHAYFFRRRRPWTKIFCNLKGNLAEDLLRAYGLQDTVLVPNFWNEQIFRDFYALSCRKEPQEKIFERCALKFHEIVSELYALQCESDRVTDEAQRLRDYLDSRVFERVSIEDWPPPSTARPIM